MKFTKRKDRVSREGTRPGFSDADVTYPNRQTHTPKTQIISTEKLEPEPEERHYYCAMCKGVLDYVKKMQMWTCTQCVEYYDPIHLQNSPIKDPTDFKLTPYTGLIHYPVYDENDSNNIFVEEIDLNTIVEDDLEIRVHEDQRVQHINLHNVTFADAILKGALSARKKQEEE